MTIEDMKRRKQELGYSYEQLSKLSGVPVGTINKVLNGYTKVPRSDTLAALERVLSRDPLDVSSPESMSETSVSDKNMSSGEYPDYSHSHVNQAERTMVRESGYTYGLNTKRMNEPLHTRSELDALPQWDRRELIDGVFYDMSAPSLLHQRLLFALARAFADQIDTHGCGESCEVLIAPVDIAIDSDEYTVVQPDLIVLCHPEQAHSDVVYGAPDLTLEVISPSTKTKDQFIKLNKYRSAGVKEYWIVDPEKKTVTVYLLAVMRGDEGTQGDEITIYGFKDQIPVWISSGECSIDMDSVRSRIEALS